MRKRAKQARQGITPKPGTGKVGRVIDPQEQERRAIRVLREIAREPIR